MNKISLSTSQQISPKSDLVKAGVKPYKLTVLFNYVHITESHPYGNGTATEDIYEAQDIEYFLDGVETPYDEVKNYLDKVGKDIDELTDQFIEKAVEIYNT